MSDQVLIIPTVDQHGVELTEEEAYNLWTEGLLEPISQFDSLDSMPKAGFRAYEGELPWAIKAGEALEEAVSPIETGVQGHPDVVKNVPNPLQEVAQPYIDGLKKLGFYGTIFDPGTSGQNIQIDSDIAEMGFDISDAASVGAIGAIRRLGTFGVRNFDKIIKDKILTGTKHIDDTIAVYLDKLHNILPDIMPDAQKKALQEGMEILESTPIRNADFAMHEMHHTLKAAGIQSEELDSVYDGVNRVLNKQAAENRFSESLSGLDDDAKDILNSIAMRDKKIQNTITEIDNKTNDLTTRFKDTFDKPWESMTDKDKNIFNRYTKLQYDKKILERYTNTYDGDALLFLGRENSNLDLEPLLKQEEDQMADIMREYGINRIFVDDMSK